MPKILIIDDEKLICDFMTDIFQDMDHKVSYESTLSRGLVTAESGDFDVIFLDVIDEWPFPYLERRNKNGFYI